MTRQIDLGMALRNYRISARISQAEMARTLGVSQSQISRWESGRDRPRAYNAHTIRGLVYGRADPEFAALVHFVSSSGAPLALFDHQHRLVAASPALAAPEAPLKTFGWALDPQQNPDFRTVFAQYRAVLDNTDGVVGLEVHVPFMHEGAPWMARAQKTVYRLGGRGICVAELTFAPEPDAARARPSLTRISPSPAVMRIVRQREAQEMIGVL